MMTINPFEVILAETSPNVITYYLFLKQSFINSRKTRGTIPEGSATRAYYLA